MFAYKLSDGGRLGSPYELVGLGNQHSTYKSVSQSPLLIISARIGVVCGCIAAALWLGHCRCAPSPPIPPSCVAHTPVTVRNTSQSVCRVCAWCSLHAHLVLCFLSHFGLSHSITTAAQPGARYPTTSIESSHCVCDIVACWPSARTRRSHEGGVCRSLLMCSHTLALVELLV
jgi:hypothetical protein